MRTFKCMVLLTSALLAAGSQAARAEVEFSVGVGYGHVSLDGSGGVFDERDGLRLEPRVSFNPVDAAPQLRLGFGLGISGYSHDVDGDDDGVIEVDDDTFIIGANDVETLTLLTPEFQLSWRQTFAADDEGRGWFVEPGVGVGAVVGQYWFGSSWWGWTDTDVSEWDATISARPFLRAGYQSHRWLAGLEASYLFGGSLAFTDDIGGDVREWYVGGFFGGRW